jgi:hypothetical protein
MLVTFLFGVGQRNSGRRHIDNGHGQPFCGSQKKLTQRKDFPEQWRVEVLDDTSPEYPSTQLCQKCDKLWKV